MVFFHTDHWGSIMHYITLAINRHYEEECILMFSGLDPAKKEILENLREKGYFKKIITIKWEFPGGFCNKEEIIKNEIMNHFDKIFIENEVSVDKDDTIYTCSDWQGVFRYYLIQKDIPFVHVMLSDAEIYERERFLTGYKHGYISKEYLDVLLKYNVFNGQNELCKRIISFPTTQVKDEISKRKIEEYDLVDAIERISVYNARNIWECFSKDTNNIKKISTLLLPNSQGYISTILKQELDKNEYVLFYQLFIDLYSGSKMEEILIKDHPNNYIDWKRYMPKIQVFDKNVPIELFHLNKDINIDKVIAIETTAIGKIRDKCNVYKKGSVDYVLNSKQIIKLYFVLKIYIENFLNRKLKVKEMNLEFLEDFSLKVLTQKVQIEKIQDIESDEKEFILLKNITVSDFFDLNALLKKLNKESVMVSLDMAENIPLNTNFADVYKYMDIIQLSKEVTEIDSIAYFETEYIYIFTKSRKTKKIIEFLSLQKEFNVTGMNVIVKTLSPLEKELFVSTYCQNNEITMQRKQISNLKKMTSERIFGNSYSLSLIKDYEVYLDVLGSMKNCLICIAIKDNAGKNHTYNMVQLSTQLGATVEWNKIGWNSYLLIIDNAKVVYEKLGVLGNPIEYRGYHAECDVEMYSKTYNKGNEAKIIINGVDYAINRRGINIVVYDKKLCKVVDSVCFDTYKETCDCVRN